MLVLFDNGTPRGIAPALEGHVVKEACDHGWDRLSNSELLDAAGHAGFDVLLTTDQNILHQQNLEGRRIAIVVLSSGRWTFVRPFLGLIATAVNEAVPGSYRSVVIPLPPLKS